MVLRYPLLFPNDITYTIGKSDYHKDWFFEEVPHGVSTAWINPNAKDPANQQFGWVKTATGQERIYGAPLAGAGRPLDRQIQHGRNPKGPGGVARGAGRRRRGGGLAITVNGKSAGNLQPGATNALGAARNRASGRTAQWPLKQP